MSTIKEAYEEIAAMQIGLYDWFRGDKIFVLIQSDDQELLDRWSKVCGKGGVVDGYIAGNSKDYKGPNSGRYEKWGRYAWTMRGDEAYEFCLGIRPYLAEFDPKRHGWCQNCIEAHLARRGYLKSQS